MRSSLLVGQAGCNVLYHLVDIPEPLRRAGHSFLNGAENGPVEVEGEFAIAS